MSDEVEPIEDGEDDRMLGEMLSAGWDGPLFLGEYRGGPFFEPNNPSNQSLAVFVNCNDLFAWGCADAEPLPLSEVAALWRAWKADPVYGSSKWACLRRGQRPQGPVERRWREHGTWGPEMEALPPREASR